MFAFVEPGSGFGGVGSEVQGPVGVLASIVVDDIVVVVLELEAAVGCASWHVVWVKSSW